MDISESRVEHPEQTFTAFNRQFQSREIEQDAVLKWAWQQEQGNSMFHIANTHTKAARAPKLVAESSYRLQKGGRKHFGDAELKKRTAVRF